MIVEELDVHTRWVETGTVRITKRVQEREVLVDEPLWRDEVDITRMPVRVEGDTMIVSLLEVVLMVEKRWWLTVVADRGTLYPPAARGDAPPTAGDLAA